MSTLNREYHRTDAERAAALDALLDRWTGGPFSAVDAAAWVYGQHDLATVAKAETLLQRLMQDRHGWHHGPGYYRRLDVVDV